MNNKKQEDSYGTKIVGDLGKYIVQYYFYTFHFISSSDDIEFNTK